LTWVSKSTILTITMQHKIITGLIFGSTIPLGLFVSSCAKSPLVQKPDVKVVNVAATTERQMGTDIDHSAGNVNWSSVRSTGTNWAYCKVSGGYSNADSDFVDPMFAKYWPQMKKAKIARGAYCFFDLNGDGTTQAKQFLKLLNSAGGLEADDLPPQLDVEWSPTPSTAPFPSGSKWQDEALEWLTYVEKETGRIPVIYTGYSMAKTRFDARFSKYPLWVARYPSEKTMTPSLNPDPKYAPKGLGPWSEWTIWQYSESGNIVGLGIGQDLDVLAGTIEDFVKKTTVKK